MVTLLVRNTSESKALLSIAKRAAAGLGHELQLILFTRKESSGVRPLKDKDSSWMQELVSDEVAEVLVCGGENRYIEAEKYLENNLPRLLLLGKHLSSNAETDDARYSEYLYQSLPCQTLLLRLGSKDEAEGERHPILVACGPGPHTTRALKIAYAIAGEDTVALHLTADVDPYSEDLAKARLRNIIKKAGIDPDAINRRVVLGTDVPKVLREEIQTLAEKDPYSMLLLGYSENRGMREKLFGTIPDQLIRKSGGLTIGVLRAAEPVQNRLRKAIEKRVRLNIPQLKREERIALFEEIENASIWRFDFAALMTLSALVAGFGLMANSGAVVIGAMLIAPLMMPLIGCGLALAQGHTPLFRNGFRAVVRGFLLALGSGLLLGLLSHCFYIPLTDELAARGNSSILDLGIAFVSGIAASYCIARPNLTGALAGVAIAAALVPPIVTTGICITMGEFEVAKGAGLLFGTNVVAVILGAALNFIMAGIIGQGKSGDFGRRFIIVLALACLGLAVPLSSVLLKTIPNLERTLVDLQANDNVRKAIEITLPEGAVLDEIIYDNKENTEGYTLKISAPYQLNQSHYDALKAAIEKEHHEMPVKMAIESKIVLGDR